MSTAKSSQKKKLTGFWRWLLIGCGSFLALVLVGLVIFWNFIAAFEQSRPQSAIARYMEGLTPEKICQLDTATAEKCDTALQSREEYERIAAEALQRITCAKNTKLSTDDKQVYMLLNAGKSIGSVTMTVVKTDLYGLDYWQVTQEDLDISYLVGKPVSVTVPSDYKVYANGTLLDSRYITESGIHYPALEDYYKKYDSLPTLCTYTTAPILGRPVVTVTDGAGNAVDPEALAAVSLPDNCTDSEQQELKTFVETFLYHYVRFTTAAGGQWRLYYNYNALLPYVLPDSNLSMRVKDSLDGLGWVLDRKAQITELTINGLADMGDGRYLCDFSYVVDGKTQSGAVRNTANVRLVVKQTENGFQAEHMTNY